MMKKVAEAKEKLLSTSVVGWKLTTSTIALILLCSGSVAIFGYLCLTLPELQCYANYFYLSILWLGSELALIGYFYRYRHIPKFAREAVVPSILISNVWFILFIFGLKECSV